MLGLLVGAWKVNGVEKKFPREELDRPPLVEALFEVRVQSSVPYALVPGHLHAELGAEFENVKELVPSFLLDAPSPPALVFHRFESKDKKRLIQCGPSVVTANVLDDYGAYDNFEALVKVALEKYFKAARPTRVARLGLRYINLIDDDIAGNKWPFAVSIEQPPSLKTEVAQSTIRLVYRDNASGGQLAVAIAQPAQLPSGRVGSLLDLDCFLEDPPQALPEIVGWAKKAHDSIYQVFRAYVEPVYGRLKERS